DPRSRDGHYAIRLTLGVFRFTAGQMLKKNVRLETPGVTIGIRGTDFIVEVSATGATKVSVLSGQVSMKPTVGRDAMVVGPGYTGSVDIGEAVGRIEACGGGDCGRAAMQS